MKSLVRVYKYGLHIDRSTRVRIESNGHFRPIKVDWQRGQIILWAEVGVDTPDTERTFLGTFTDLRFWVFPTGESFNLEGLQYVDSAISDDLVYHVYQEV